MVTSACSDLDCLKEYDRILVPEEENYAANVVWMNGSILIPEGFAGVKRLLVERGYQIIEMPVSEIAKMDGGLTCLSLRLTG